MLDVVTADAQILVGSYQLACDPHQTQEWKTYRSNSIVEENYNLYGDYFISNNADAVTLNPVETAIYNALAHRDAAKGNMLSTGVMQGYEEWSKKQ